MQSNPLPYLQSTISSRPYPLLQHTSFRDRSSFGELENSNLENKGNSFNINPGVIGASRMNFNEPIGLGFQLDETKLSSQRNEIRNQNGNRSLSSTPETTIKSDPMDLTPTRLIPTPKLSISDNNLAVESSDSSLNSNFQVTGATGEEGKDEIVRDLQDRVEVLEDQVQSLTNNFNSKVSNLSLEISTLRSLFLSTIQSKPSTPSSTAHPQFYYSQTTERESFITEREKERETSNSPILTLRSPSPLRMESASSFRSKGLGYLNPGGSNGNLNGGNGIISPGYTNNGFIGSNNGMQFGDQRPTSSSSSISNFLHQNSNQNQNPNFTPERLNSHQFSSPALNSPNMSSVIDSWKSSLTSPALANSARMISTQSTPGIGLGTPPTHSIPNSVTTNGITVGMIRSISANGLVRNGGGGNFGGVGELREEKRRTTFGAVGSPGEIRARPDSVVEGANWEDGKSVNGATSSPSAGSVSGNGSGSVIGSLGGKWEVLGVGSDLFRCIVKYGLGPPTKIQMKAIPCVLRNLDVVAQAPSIQERIQSYVVPALQLIHNSISNGESTKGLNVLIITATVDQAAQAQRLSSGLGNVLGIKTGLCVGIVKNLELKVELNELINQNVNILVGTPIKVLELFKLGQLNLTQVKLLIIDECDQLIARNLSDYLIALTKFLPSSNASLTTISRSPNPSANTNERSKSPLSFNSNPPAIIERQTAIFSCTVPQDVLNFAASLNLREPVRVLVRREGVGLNSNGVSTPNTPQSTYLQSIPSQNSPLIERGGERMEPIRSLSAIKQYFVYLPNSTPSSSRGQGVRDSKLESLIDVMEDLDFVTTIIFCNSLETIEAVSYKIASRGMEVLSLHHEMGSIARSSIINKFKSPTSIGTRTKRCLIVIDSLIKSLDFNSISLVINFELPRMIEDYSNRVQFLSNGSLARAGILINFVTPGSDVDTLRSIESAYRIKFLELPNSI